MEDSPDKTNLDLLDKTQAYLRSRVIQQSGNSTLGLLWNRFYTLYDALLRRFAAARGLRSHDLDDCVQAVWMRISTRLAEFEHPRERPGLRSWLYTLVRNESYDVLYRKRLNRLESLDEARGRTGEPVDPTPDAADALDRKWRKALLKTVLEDMREEISDQNWKLLEMRFGQGMNADQIAVTLGLTADEVRYRQFRLVKKIKRRAAALTGETNSVNI